MCRSHQTQNELHDRQKQNLDIKEDEKKLKTLLVKKHLKYRQIKSASMNELLFETLPQLYLQTYIYFDSYKQPISSENWYAYFDLLNLLSRLRIIFSVVGILFACLASARYVAFIIKEISTQFDAEFKLKLFILTRAYSNFLFFWSRFIAIMAALFVSKIMVAAILCAHFITIFTSFCINSYNKSRYFYEEISLNEHSKKFLNLGQKIMQYFLLSSLKMSTFVEDLGHEFYSFVEYSLVFAQLLLMTGSFCIVSDVSLFLKLLILFSSLTSFMCALFIEKCLVRVLISKILSVKNNPTPRKSVLLKYLERYFYNEIFFDFASEN